MAHIPHMMDAPRLPLAGPIAEAIEDHGDRFVVADLGELGDQFDRLVIGDPTVVARPGAGHSQVRVDAAFPVQVQDVLRRVVGIVHDDLFEHRAQDPLLQHHGRGRVRHSRRRSPPRASNRSFSWSLNGADCVRSERTRASRLATCSSA